MRYADLLLNAVDAAKRTGRLPAEKLQ
jgi:hypothetical protein